MLNKVILTGKLGRDPHAYFSQEGKEIVTFSLATTQSWKDETGEWHSATDWHRITVFREPTIKWIKDVLKRGHKVYVEGKLTYQQWTDTFGQKRLTPHVVITGREGRVEEIRPAASSVSLASNQNLNLNVANSTSELNPEEKVVSLASEKANEEANCLEVLEEQMTPKN